MHLSEGFARFIEAEVGSLAPAALRANLEDRGYRIYAGIDDCRTVSREAYHPDRGIFKGSGINETHAFIGLLRQAWLVESFEGTPEWKAGPTN